MTYALPPPRGRWLPYALVGGVVTGAAVAIATVLASSDPGLPKGQVSFTDIAAASQPVVEAARVEQVAPAPPPPAPDPADTAGEAELVVTADDLEAECRGFQVDRKWSELAQCADQLAPLERGRAAELEARAAKELEAAPRVAAFEAALRDRNLRRAKAELDRIWSESVEYPELKRKYESAEAQTIARLAAELAQVKDSGCEEYQAFLDKQRSSKPKNVLDAAARRTSCTPEAKCDADALAQQAHAHFSAHRLDASLRAYEAAYACSPTPSRALQTFMVACNLRNVAKARSYWKQIPPHLRAQARSICAGDGITEAQLNAP
jgi:hypothetical protein